MGDYLNHDPQRPWTVQVLVGFIIGSALWALVYGEATGLAQLVSLALSVVVAWALWRGIGWVYRVSFMLLSLCAGLMLLVGGIRLFLLEEGVAVGSVGALVMTVAFLALLLHPDTKRFVRVENQEVTA